MDEFFEDVSGTWSPRSAHPHNGYYAGDFSSVPFHRPDLGALLSLTRTTRRSTGSRIDSAQLSAATAAAQM